jgi:hypothetical protein
MGIFLINSIMDRVIVDGVLSHPIASVLPPVEAELTPLPKGHLTAIHSADKGFLISVGILMFFAILKQREGFRAIPTFERLLLRMHQLVATE